MTDYNGMRKTLRSIALSGAQSSVRQRMSGLDFGS
jgi:hypothetical protein